VPNNSPIEAKLIGATALKRKFSLMDQRVRGAMKRLVNEHSRKLTNRAKKEAPVDMGQLRASIRPQFFSNGLTSRIATNTGYAAFVEYGTGPLGRMTAKNTPKGYVHSVSLKRPPPDVIFEWVWRNRKNMGGSGWTKSQAKGVAFLIGRAIGKRGLRARAFMGPAYIETKKEFERDVRREFKRTAK